MTIKWLGRTFEGPFSLSYWVPPKKPAIYAIMMKPDPVKAPTSFRILFFGQTSKLSNPRFYKNHKRLSCWTNYAGAADQLFIGYHIIDSASPEEMEGILSDLIEHYKPVCNF